MIGSGKFYMIGSGEFYMIERKVLHDWERRILHDWAENFTRFSLDNMTGRWYNIRTTGEIFPAVFHLWESLHSEKKKDYLPSQTMTVVRFRGILKAEVAPEKSPIFYLTGHYRYGIIYRHLGRVWHGHPLGCSSICHEPWDWVLAGILNKVAHKLSPFYPWLMLPLVVYYGQLRGSFLRQLKWRA